jgi:hypothetical protein
MTSTIRAACIGFALMLAGPANAAASSADDDVLAGYQKFYRGDKQGATRDFERLVAADPARLTARFGLLEVLEDRSGTNHALEPEFERQMDAFINDATLRYERSDKDDEALFYLANAHMLRGRYGSITTRACGARRATGEVEALLRRYVRRHPEHGDAYFALGTYNYYVEIAPALIKFIRPLLFLPAGDRVEGLKQLERAYTQGSLFSFQAGMLLMEVYGSFEGRPEDGVRIGERLPGSIPTILPCGSSSRTCTSGPRSRTTRVRRRDERVIAAESKRAEARRALRGAARPRLVADRAVAC